MIAFLSPVSSIPGRSAPSPRPAPATGVATFHRCAVAILAILCLIALPATAPAAELKGRVFDRSNDEPVSNAIVTLFADTLAGGAASRTDGTYRIAGLKPGRFRVRVQALGYDVLEDTLVVPSAGLSRDFGLGVDAIAIPEVRVEGRRVRTDSEVQPGIVEITPEQIERVPGVAEKDIFRSLQLLPGVSTASDISSGLYIRGGGPDQNLVLFDDAVVYNPTHAFGFFSTFEADAIRDVTLYKGTPPAEYGGRLGSVVDVTSRSGNATDFRGKGGVSLIAARLTLEGPVGRGSWLVSGRRTYLDPILNAIRNEDNEIPSYYFYDTTGRFTQRLSPRDEIAVSYYLGLDNLGLDLDRGTNLDLSWGNQVAVGRWTRTLGPKAVSTVTGSWSRYRSRSRISVFSTPIRFDNGVDDVTLRGRLTLDPTPAHRVKTGIDLSKRRFHLEQEFNRDLQPGIDDRPGEAAVFVQDDWTPMEGTTFRAGLRGAWYESSDRFDLEPRVSVTRRLSPTLKLKLGGGLFNQRLQLVSTEGFSAADFWVPIDGTADAGRAYQGVSGLEWTPSKQWNLSAESYFTDLSGLVQLDNARNANDPGTTSADLFRTGGTGYATGLELFAQKRTGALTGWAGYTLGWSRRKFAEVNGGRTYPPKYDRRHDVNVVLDWNQGKWRFGAAAVYGTGQAFTPAGARYLLVDPSTGERPGDEDLILPAAKNSGRLKSFARLDLNVAREGRLFGTPVEWTLQIFNALNRKNEWFIEYDTSNPEIEPQVTYQLPIIPTVGVNFAF